MTAPAVYGITARRGDALIRCEDAATLTELAALVAAYAQAFGRDRAVRVEIDTLACRPATGDTAHSM